MRAVVLPEFGSPLEIQDISVPEPAEGEIRVRVHAASVNGFDLAVANGYMNGMMEHRFPVVLGKDFAGVVDAVGDRAGGFAVGDRVFGVVTKPFLGDGSFAEFVTVPVSVGVAALPDSVDFATGATLGLAGTAALDAFVAAGVGPGSVVLISGATGGVGAQVVQLAVAAGATVVATAHSEPERAQVRLLGATEIVDYTEDVVAQVRALHPEGVDVVVHLAGDPQTLLPAVKDGGRFVSTLVGSPEQLPAEGVTVASVMANPTGATLRRLAGNQADGTTSVTVQSEFDLASAADAFAAFGAGTVGKVLITVA